MDTSAEIPAEVRAVLDDTMTDCGMCQWWTAQLRYLDDERPCDWWERDGWRRASVMQAARNFAEGVYL
jgi:hypothetical protein